MNVGEEEKAEIVGLATGCGKYKIYNLIEIEGVPIEWSARGTTLPVRCAPNLGLYPDAKKLRRTPTAQDATFRYPIRSRFSSGGRSCAMIQDAYPWFDASWLQ